MLRRVVSAVATRLSMVYVLEVLQQCRKILTSYVNCFLVGGLHSVIFCLLNFTQPV